MDQSYQDQLLTFLASQLTDWVGVLFTAPFILPDGQFLKPISTFFLNQLAGVMILTSAGSQLAEWVGVLLAGR